MTFYGELREQDDRDKNVFPFFRYELYGNPGVLVPVHWHDEIEIIYPVHRGRLLIDGYDVEFDRGDILFVESRRLHGTFLKYGGLVYHILIDRAVEDICRGVFSLPVIIHAAPDRYTDIMDKLVSYISPVESMVDRFDILRDLYTLFSYVASDGYYEETLANKKNDNQKMYVLKCMEYISDNITEDISIDIIADGIGISRTYLMKLFKMYTGGTIGRYIMNTRLDEAKKDLEKGETVLEIAYRYDFADTAHFCNRFKERFGCSPGSLRKMNEKKI